MINENELPKDWRWAKMEDVCSKIGDIDHKMPKHIASGYPYVSTKDFTNDLKISFDNAKYISKEDFLNLSRKIKPEKGDVIFPRYGTIGKNILVDFDKEFLVSYSCAILKPEPNLVLSKFLYLYSLSPQITDEIRKYIVETTQANVGISSIKKFVFPVPPLAEQERIVAKIEELFSELDAGLQSLKTAQQQLKIYRQAVLKWAFEGKLTNENVNKGELPSGWKLTKLGEVGALLSGQHILEKDYNFNENGIAYFTGPADFGDYYPIVSKWTTKPKTIALQNSVLITVKGAGVGKINILNIEKAAISRQLMSYNSNFIKYKYLFFYLGSKFHDFQRLGLGSTVPGIGRETILNYTIPLCPLEEQKRIVQEIESRLSVCDKLEETINTALRQSEALRQSILKAAFAGKLVKSVAAQKPVFKPKKLYFYQVQTLGLILRRSGQKGIRHGEMTAAKYAYLVDKLYGVPTFYRYQRWHLGPYSHEIKKAVNNKRFFAFKNNQIEVVNEKIFEYDNPYKNQIETAVDDLAKIFATFPDRRERAHKTELLATVCKVVEDAQTLEINQVRQAMHEWEIDLANLFCKTKAEKFTEEETVKCLDFIVKRGWSEKSTLR